MHVRRTAAAVAIALLLAACTTNADGPGDEPTPSGSSTSSASPTPSSSPAPTLPEAARGRGIESAEKFVRYYIDLNNHAMTTGDTAPLLEEAGPDCKSCKAAVDSFRAIYDVGGRVEADGWRVHQALPVAASKPEAPIFLVMIYETPGREYGPDGKVKTVIEPTKTTLRFDLRPQDGAWIVHEWSIVR